MGMSGGGRKEEMDDATRWLLITIFVVAAAVAGMWIWVNYPMSLGAIVGVLLLTFLIAAIVSLIIAAIFGSFSVDGSWEPAYSQPNRVEAHTYPTPPAYSEPANLETTDGASETSSLWPRTGWGWWIWLNLLALSIGFLVAIGKLWPIVLLSAGLASATEHYLHEPLDCPIPAVSLWWLRFFAYFIPLIGLILTVSYLTRQTEAEQHMGMGFLTLWLWGGAIEVAAYFLLIT